MVHDKRHGPRPVAIRPALVPAWVPEPLARIETIATIVGFALLGGVAIGVRQLADLSPSELAQPWLLREALFTKLPLLVVAVVASAIAARFGRASLFLRWGELERGSALRTFSMILVALLTWRFLAADYDYAFGQWWALDRLGLLLFAALSWLRPIGLAPFILQARLLQGPLRTAFGFASGATLDDLPLTALMCVLATVGTVVVLGRPKTHVFVNLLAAGVAIQFFNSGLRKVSDRWLFDNDLSNFPLNGFHQGWLGAGDGALADAISQFFSTFRWPLLIGTLVLEVGAIVLIGRRRFLMLGLVGWTTFHLAVFLGYGFSFLEWAVVELGFLILLARSAGQTWSKPSFRLLPVAITAVFVLVGGVIFKPPTLAWFDGPITYAYEFDALDVDGNERLLVANDFAPHESAFAFALLHLGPTDPVAAGYGALNRQRFDELAVVDSWEDLESLESPSDVESFQRARAVANIERFLLSAGQNQSVFDRLPDGLTRYSTSRAGQNGADDVALQSLRVTRVTTLRIDGEVLTRQELVAEFRVVDGQVAVDWADVD